MARTKGSLNKPKSSNIVTLNFEKQIAGAAVNKKNPLGWVNYGAKNNYPLLLLDLYAQSPTHHSAIDFGVLSIIGEGVDYEAMQLDGTQTVPNYIETWDNLIKSLSLDFMLYGSYSLQVIKNKDGKTFSFYHTPFEKVRFTDYDEDGQITKYYICSDWTQPSMNPPIMVDAFDMLADPTKLEKGKPYLYVYRPYCPTSNYYPSPSYQASIKAIQSEIEFVNFDLKSTTNGFVPSGCLILNEVETDEERQAIIKNINNMFIGGENANSLMISFRRNMEEKAPEFVPFNTDTRADKYDYTNDRTINRILTAHKIPSPMLIGLPDNSKNGFSSDASKMEAAYGLYNKLAGNSNRNAIISTINQLFKINGVDVEIIMKPLRFTLEDNVAPTTTVADNNINTNENNIEEQTVGEE